MGLVSAKEMLDKAKAEIEILKAELKKYQEARNISH